MPLSQERSDFSLSAMRLPERQPKKIAHAPTASDSITVQLMLRGSTPAPKPTAALSSESATPRDIASLGERV